MKFGFAFISNISCKSENDLSNCFVTFEVYELRIVALKQFCKTGAVVLNAT